MPDFTTAEYSYADFKANILGSDLSGLRGLKYKKSQTKEAVTGQGNRPKAIQRGGITYTGTLMVLKSDYDLMHDAALAAGYDDLIDVPAKAIVLTTLFQKEGDTLVRSDVLYNVEFTEVEDGLNTGDMYGVVSLPFIALGLKKS